MIRFLEQNGYDVSYISGLDTSVDPTASKHKVFCLSGTTSTGPRPARQRGGCSRRQSEPGLLRRQRGLLEDPMGTALRTERTPPIAPWSATRTPGPTPHRPSRADRTWRDPRFGPVRTGELSDRHPLPVNLLIWPSMSTRRRTRCVYGATRDSHPWLLGRRLPWPPTPWGTNPTRTSTMGAAPPA